jgi:acyl carrier protein phosphodiesterase
VALWVVAGLGLLVAAVALASARRLARRLDALTQSYWELRYDYTRLRSQISRLDPGLTEEAAEAPPPPAPSVSFVPLSSFKKKP